MGRLYWRERFSALGCRRGWWRAAALVGIPVLVGYLGLYGYLRANRMITMGEMCLYGMHDYSVETREPNGRLLDMRTIDDRFGENNDWRYTSPFLMMIWPAARLEIALGRRGWLPYNGMINLPCTCP